MAALIIMSDDKASLKDLEEKIKTETDFTDVAVYNNLLGFWTDVDCYTLIYNWTNEDKNNRIEIINQLGGIDAAVKILAYRADKYFDANVGITWEFLEDIWNTIVKEQKK